MMANLLALIFTPRVIAILIVFAGILSLPLVAMFRELLC